MRYHNLVYCKHHEGDRRAYLYELPLDKEVKPGDKLCVRDRNGEQKMTTAFCENWLCSDKITEILCVANGGYFPPAKVIGTVDVVTIQQEIVNKFEKEEEFPWF